RRSTLHVNSSAWCSIITHYAIHNRQTWHAATLLVYNAGARCSARLPTSPQRKGQLVPLLRLWRGLNVAALLGLLLLLPACDLLGGSPTATPAPPTLTAAPTAALSPGGTLPAPTRRPANGTPVATAPPATVPPAPSAAATVAGPQATALATGTPPVAPTQAAGPS